MSFVFIALMLSVWLRNKPEHSVFVYRTEPHLMRGLGGENT